jgi:hypothetical protein
MAKKVVKKPAAKKKIKKAAPKKSAPKKVKKAAPKKAAPKKAVVKKVAVKKPVPKKAVTIKTAPKKIEAKPVAKTLNTKVAEEKIKKPLPAASDPKNKISDDETIPTIDDFVEDRVFKKGPALLLDDDEDLDETDFLEEDEDDSIPKIGGKVEEEYEEYTIEDDKGWVDDEEEIEKEEVEEEEDLEEEDKDEEGNDPHRRGGFY